MKITEPLMLGDLVDELGRDTVRARFTNQKPAVLIFVPQALLRAVELRGDFDPQDASLST